MANANSSRLIGIFNVNIILKCFIPLCTFLLLCCYVNASQAEVKGSDDKNGNNHISLKFHQADVGIILQALADSKEMNLVMAEDITTKHTVRLNNIDWQKALSIILNTAQLQASIDDNTLFISKVTKQKENTPDYKPNLEHLTFTIKHMELTELSSMVNQPGFLSEQGNAIIDKRTNSLIIHDVKSQIDTIRRVIKQLDKPIPQIHISAHIVTMSHESLSELGIKWGYSGRSSQLLDKFDVGLATLNPAASVGFNLAKRSGHLLNLELSALEAENQVEIIASPNLLTSNHHMASIKQGTEIPYEVSSGNNGATAIEFKQAVLGLEVTPRILSNEQLILDLYITQNTAGQSIKRSDGGESLAIDTQEIKTQVLVKNGETIILGGIFQQQNSQNNQKVPTINELPIVGHLFKNSAKKYKKRELVIFITPQLVE